MNNTTCHGRCPQCGYCPCCGRSNKQQFPYQPWQFPIVTYGGSTGGDTITPQAMFNSNQVPPNTQAGIGSSVGGAL